MILYQYYYLITLDFQVNAIRYEIRLMEVILERKSQCYYFSMARSHTSNIVIHRQLKRLERKILRINFKFNEVAKFMIITPKISFMPEISFKIVTKEVAVTTAINI